MTNESTMTRQSKDATRLSWPVLIAFACVYVFWGSTYTAIKVGTELLPAFVLTGVRFLISGSLMLAYCRLRGLRILVNKKDLAWLALLGFLMLGIGNFALVWSEKSLPSGLAALIVAVVPLYVALLGLILPRGERLRSRGWLGLLLGFGGLTVLLWPSMHASGQTGQAAGSVMLLLGSLAWAGGSLLSRRLKLPVDVLVAAGWEMLVAGIVNATLATVQGEWPLAHWTPAAMGSIGYLVTFGSLVGFTAYIWLLEHVPVPKVATYAYVNPVVAVILGALILGERLTKTENVGMVAVVIAVGLVTSSQLQSGTPVAELECTAVEGES
jgi:drug/metabolite transporter (DMT)-like permease